MPTVSLNKMIEKLDLKNLTPDIATDGIEISSPDINRPHFSWQAILNILPASGYRLLVCRIHLFEKSG